MISLTHLGLELLLCHGVHTDMPARKSIITHSTAEKHCRERKCMSMPNLRIHGSEKLDGMAAQVLGVPFECDDIRAGGSATEACLYKVEEEAALYKHREDR